MSDYYSNLRKTRNQQFETDKSELEAYRSLARQEASINNELLKKYLPQLNAQNGLTGLGIADSINLEQLSRYQNTLTDIDRQYNEGLSELERAYRSDMQGYDAAERGEQRADAQREEAYEREDSRNAYNTAKYDLDEGSFSDYEDFVDYLGTLPLSQTDYDSLLEYGESYFERVDETEENDRFDDYKESIGTYSFSDENALKDLIISWGYEEGSSEYNELLRLGNKILADKMSAEDKNIYNRVSGFLEYADFTTEEGLREWLKKQEIDEDFAYYNELYNAGLQKIDKYNEAVAKEADDRYNAAYDEVMTYIEAGYITDSVSLAKFLQGLVDAKTITSEDMAELTNDLKPQLDFIANSIQSEIPKPDTKYTATYSSNSETAGLEEVGAAFAVDLNGNQLVLTSEGVADDSIKTVAKDIGDGKLFLYDDNIYLKKSGKVYAVGAHDSARRYYSELYNFLKYGTTPKSDYKPTTGENGNSQANNSNGVSSGYEVNDPRGDRFDRGPTTDPSYGSITDVNGNRATYTTQDGKSAYVTLEKVYDISLPSSEKNKVQFVNGAPYVVIGENKYKLVF